MSKNKKIFLAAVVSLFFVSSSIFILKLYQDMKYEAFTLINYNPDLTTQIFDKHGELIANYFSKKNRLYVAKEDIPPRLIEALISIEDTVFFEHHGVNFEAVARAAIKNIIKMKKAEGASTLTQQLIKNTLLSSEKTYKRKIKEAFLAFIIENELTKEEIIERYLNEVFFGHGYYGIRTASEGYFRKSLSSLTLKEIAILVGIPRSPNAYDPSKHYNNALARANRVLSRMEQIGWISYEEYEIALLEQPEVFNDTLTKNRAPYVVDEVIKQATALYDDVSTGGYQIHLGVDLQVQDLATQALEFGYKNILERNPNANATIVNGAFVVLDNYDGDVLALVGGVNHSASSFNRAISSQRQPGSSFKPFVYKIALDFGYSTVSKIPDISRIYASQNEEEDDWAPKNIEENYQGLITLKDALVKSRNLATINLVNDVGLDVMYGELKKLGFNGLQKDLSSIALGSFGISPIEYGKFFGMFANGGEIVEPIFIKKIINKFGTEKVFVSNKKRFVDSAQNYLMVDMLKGVVERGTGRGARVNGIEIAGKTGTSNENKDTWFCGFSPDINVAVWYGNDNNEPMQKTEVGGRTSGQPFAYFMERYIKLYPETKRVFTIPKGVNKAIYNGKVEYFTVVSPFPSATKSHDNDENLIF